MAEWKCTQVYLNKIATGSWITAATLVAGEETWKRATSPTTHFRRSFWLRIASP